MDDSAAAAQVGIERARERLSSYIYGNILVLTVAAAASAEAIEHGAAVVSVVATTITTFLAHALAHVVAHRIGTQNEPMESPLPTLKGAVPILTSGVVPAGLYLLAFLDVFPSTAVQVVASGYLVVRIGFIGVVVRRLSGRRSRLALWSGISLAALSILIVALKLTFAH
ncbi:hypothetical protein ES5_01081 [Dietzia cinnamea P4]|nr:hypothetical protein ES5_01081 [Dietzia cinnamea P4]OAH57131.1 hypothetical protein AYJ66_15120 [Dietzia cinnamea]